MSDFAQSMPLKHQQAADVADSAPLSPPIAEIFLARGWAQRLDRRLCLTDSETFWGSIDRIVGELATIGYFPTLAWLRHASRVLQGQFDSESSAELKSKLDSWFEQRAYRIRHPELADMPDLLRLEKECWIEPLRATEAELRQRILDNPQGHYLLEMDGQVAGVIYSQRIVDAERLLQTNFRDVAALHRADGPIVQPLAVNVLPAMEQYGLGDQLLEFLLQLATWQPDVERVVAGR